MSFHSSLVIAVLERSEGTDLSPCLLLCVPLGSDGAAKGLALALKEERNHRGVERHSSGGSPRCNHGKQVNPDDEPFHLPSPNSRCQLVGWSL